MEWISVKDKLPEESGQVLIFTKAHSVYVSHYKKSRNLFTAYGVESVLITDIETTHWMPLPERPQEKKPRKNVWGGDIDDDFSNRIMKNAGPRDLIFNPPPLRGYNNHEKEKEEN
jgi:hypothetical protein